MNRLISKTDRIFLKLKSAFFEKKDGVDQIIVMFIIIAVAAGFAGLIYVFGTTTLLPAFETKILNLINGWFDHT